MKKKNLFPQIVFLSFLPIFLFLLPLQSFSQDFPSKPITLYVGFEPGASTDVTGRVFAKEAEKLLGVPVVVENKPGANTSVAAALLAKKKPDGYTLALIVTTALTGSHIMTKNVSVQPFKDFTFILSYGRYNGGGLCVQKESPFKTLQELIDHARKNPGALSYSATGVGNIHHLAVEYMAKQAGVKFKGVPFAGATPAMTALLGGHVDFIGGGGSHLKYVRQGIWRMLAIMVGERDPNFPNVPTFKEFGYGIPAAVGGPLLVAPRDLPDPIFKKLESAFRQAAHSPELRKTLEQWDMPVIFTDRRQLETDLPKEYKFYSEFIEELGLLKK